MVAFLRVCMSGVSLRLQPVRELFDDRRDSGMGGVHAIAGLRVRSAAREVQTLEFGPIGSQRPPAVGRHTVDQSINRHIQPDRHPIAIDDRTVLWIHKCAASGGDHEVPGGHLFHQHLALDGAEVGFAMLGKNGRDRLVLVPLDELIHINRAPVETPRERARDGTLASAHESNKIDLVGLHATNRCSVSKNPGYEMATTSEPSMRDDVCPASAANANAIAIR